MGDIPNRKFCDNKTSIRNAWIWFAFCTVIGKVNYINLLNKIHAKLYEILFEKWFRFEFYGIKFRFPTLLTAVLLVHRSAHF